MAETSKAIAERHASWTELFFDLIAVAGVGTLAHALHEPTGPGLALFVLGFGAFWMSWMSHMVHRNAAGEQSRPNGLMRGMFGLSVMAAAVPGLSDYYGHEHTEHVDRPVQAVVFAIAYLATRWASAGSWRRGQLLTDWPVAQQVTGALPWLASIWAPTSWTLWLWGLGLLIDGLVLVFLSSADIKEHAEQRLDHLRSDRPSLLEKFEGFSEVTLDAGHLSERLGLFVIIVLGEGVVQSVDAASGATWDRTLLVTGLAALVLLLGLFSTSVLHGHAGVPLLEEGAIPRRLELALHGLTAAALVVIAAGLGNVVASGGELPRESTRWMLFGALASYFVIGAVASVIGRRLSLSRLLLWVVTGVVVPIVLALVADNVRGVGLTWYAAAAVWLHLALLGPRHRPEASISGEDPPAGNVLGVENDGRH